MVENKTIRYTSKPCPSCKTVNSGIGCKQTISPGLPDLDPSTPAPAPGRPYLDYFGMVRLTCKSCSRPCYAMSVLGKFRADKKCDARCTNARGHDCECSCGGHNHGKAHE